MGADIFTIPIQAGMNIGSTFLSNMLAQDNFQKSAQTNFMYNERAANAADRRTRALYNDLYSPIAKLQQAEKAGLSPSVIAGGEALGAGGSTAGAMAAGAAGNQIPTFGINPVDIASIKLMEAQAKKANAEAKTEAGENDRGAAQIAQMLADAGHKEAAKDLLELDANYQKIKNYVADATKEIDIKTANAMYENQVAIASKNYFSAVREEIAANQDIETYKTTIQQQLATLNETLARTNLYKQQSQTEITKRDAALSDICIKWYEADIKNADQEAQQTWFEDQIELRKAELGLDTDKFKFDKKTATWGLVLDGVKTACWTGALIFTRGGAAIGTNFGKSTPTNLGNSPLPKPTFRRQHDKGKFQWGHKQTGRPLYDF